MATQQLLTAAEVKDYLRIPYNDDDNMIASMITAGYSYLRGAVEEFDDLMLKDEFFTQAKDWVLRFWMPTAYNDREGGMQGAPDLNYVARSALMQLQLYEGGQDD